MRLADHQQKHQKQDSRILDTKYWEGAGSLPPKKKKLSRLPFLMFLAV